MITVLGIGFLVSSVLAGVGASVSLSTVTYLLGVVLSLGLTFVVFVLTFRLLTDRDLPVGRPCAGRGGWRRAGSVLPVELSGDRRASDGRAGGWETFAEPAPSRGATACLNIAIG